MSLDEVRAATVDDVSTVVELMRRFGAEYDDLPEPGAEERVTRFLADESGGAILLIGEPAFGLLTLRLRTALWVIAPEGWVEELYVAPEQRGQGHGRSLLQAGIAAARAAGACHLELVTTDQDHAAVGLYRAAGLRETEDDDPASGRAMWFGLTL